MADSSTDFLTDYQALARQSWAAWSRQLKQSLDAAGGQASPVTDPATAAGEAIERSLDGLKGYLAWMQTVGATAAPKADWQQQLQQWFGAGSQPFAQAFAGIDGAGAEGFARQWQTWLQALPVAGGIGTAPTPAFGLDREQQMHQQALVQAMLAAMDASGRYHALLQRAGAQAMEHLQDKLAQHAEPGRQVDSLKGLYDLWVDAGEEAYAEMALSDEFKAVYGEMVNTQMRARQLQQQQTEALCQQLGMPTRSEVSRLGERLQALRREVRGQSRPGTDTTADGELAALHREVAALKRQLVATTPSAKRPSRSASTTAAPRPVRRAAARKTTPAAIPTRKRGAAAGAAAKGKVAGRRQSPVTAPSRAKSRTRK